MELSSRLTDQLSLLALDVARDGTGLIEGLSTLVASLDEAVSGFAGLQLTIVHTGHPVRLTSLVVPRPDRAVVSSLRLPLPPVSPAFQHGSRLVVWSSVPGSLVDLAADLRHVLATTSADDGAAVPELDLDLPLPDLMSGVEGLDELATIHRAAGFLIEDGYDPGSVYDTLRGRATREGVSTYVWADRLLHAR